MKQKISFTSLCFIIGMIGILLSSCSKDEKKDDNNIPLNSVIDVDGNIYKTVVIGSQTWMAENLKVTHYRNGDSIINAANKVQWQHTLEGAYCEINNDIENASTYGRLYNWFAVDDLRKIAPHGWHVPTMEEWMTLRDLAGGYLEAGGKLKEVGSEHWIQPTGEETDEYGFAALPAGSRSSLGKFSEGGRYCFFLASNPADIDNSWNMRIFATSKKFTSASFSKQNGYSIRCIKD